MLFDKANSAIPIRPKNAIRRAAATSSHRSAGNSWRELVKKSTTDNSGNAKPHR